MKKMNALRTCLALAAIVATSLTMAAQQSDRPDVEPSMLYAPLVFDNYDIHPATSADKDNSPYSLDAGDAWLQEAMSNSSRARQTRQRAMIDNPQLVAYNANRLPEAPPEGVIPSDPRQGMLSITPAQTLFQDVTPPDAPPLPVHHWLHVFNASLQFTQAYISGNWYQGGENNLALLGSINWNCNLNQDLHPNWLFNNALSYKLGIATTHGDSIRKYLINEDNFLFTSQLGDKAVKNWYYSAMLQFTTQFLNNYKVNTRTMTAAFLSPAELNLGLGMTYNYKDKDGYKTLTLSISPLSYNMKICRDIVKLDPTKFGIDAGKHTKHSFGSALEMKFEWKITPSISWKTRFYAFTDYKYVQGDWENTFSFAVSSHLNTQIFTHLRYDKSRPWNADWKYWQFKEILSFGLTYKFATK